MAKETTVKHNTELHSTDLPSTGWIFQAHHETAGGSGGVLMN